eukprot:scaffold100300_cov61-Attheya_sp.AAC.1
MTVLVGHYLLLIGGMCWWWAWFSTSSVVVAGAEELIGVVPVFVFSGSTAPEGDDVEAAEAPKEMASSSRLISSAFPPETNKPWSRSCSLSSGTVRDGIPSKNHDNLAILLM